MQKSVGRLVSILYRKNQVYLNCALKSAQITASELPFLLYFFRNDTTAGISQEALSAYLLIDKAATARAVQSLLKKGFLRKEKDEADRRANKIFLTELGEQQRTVVQARLQQWTQFLTEGLDAQSVDTMFHVLEQMVEKMETTDWHNIWRNAE